MVNFCLLLSITFDAKLWKGTKSDNAWKLLFQTKLNERVASERSGVNWPPRLCYLTPLLLFICWLSEGGTSDTAILLENFWHFYFK